jgi:hypothetical protein
MTAVQNRRCGAARLAHAVDGVELPHQPGQDMTKPRGRGRPRGFVVSRPGQQGGVARPNSQGRATCASLPSVCEVGSAVGATVGSAASVGSAVGAVAAVDLSSTRAS